MIYTGNDLVADIGGYLGLFLGFSVFGLFEMFEKTYKKVKSEGGVKKTLTRRLTMPT